MKKEKDKKTKEEKLVEKKDFDSDGKQSSGEIKRFWNWLWHSNSVASWIAAFLLAFILVRFILLPFLSLGLQTSLPLVVVESTSMEHFEDFDKWWQSQENIYKKFFINKTDAESWPLKNGLKKGDIVIIFGKNPEKIKQGNIIVFRAGGTKALIHRVVDVEKFVSSEGNVTKTEIVFSTKGDNNIGQLESERTIKENQVEGVALARIPYLGWLKLIFVEAFSGGR